MAWNYREPRREDFDTEEEFLEAKATYDWAQEQYIEECRERYMEEKEYN